MKTILPTKFIPPETRVLQHTRIECRSNSSYSQELSGVIEPVVCQWKTQAGRYCGHDTSALASAAAASAEAASAAVASAAGASAVASADLNRFQQVLSSVTVALQITDEIMRPPQSEAGALRHLRHLRLGHLWHRLWLRCLRKRHANHETMTLAASGPSESACTGW